MDDLSDPVVIGIIGSPHGVSGTVRVRPTGSGNHLRACVEPAVDGVRRRIIRSRETPKGFLIDLEGISGRLDAKKFRGKELTLERSELDALGADEVYVGDLVGIEARDESGEMIGVVIETFKTPAHEILVVRGTNSSNGAGERYIPFTLEHVPEVDIKARRIVVRLPEE